jgi:hypothetical protein
MAMYWEKLNKEGMICMGMWARDKGCSRGNFVHTEILKLGSEPKSIKDIKIGKSHL